MNTMSKWRAAGRVKHARKRALKKVDIKMGRVLSMQQYLQNTAHQNHQHEEVAVEETPVSTHQLVDKDNGDVVDTGTEYEMRKLRTKLGAADYSVRKVK